MSIYSRKNFQKLQIAMARILINFDRSLTNLQRTGQRFRGTFFCQIFVKIVELMDKKHKILHRGQTDPALQKT